LVGWGADVTATFPAVGGDTALHIALKGGFFDSVVLLLDSNSNIEALDSNGLTPLYYAAKHGMIDFMKLFLYPTVAAFVGAPVTAAGVAGANVNAAGPDNNGVTVLYHAVQNGQPMVVQELLNAPGITVDTVDTAGVTPFWYAALNGHYVIMDALITAGANKEIEDLHGFTPMAMAASYNRVAIVNYLITKNAVKVGLLGKTMRNFLGARYFESICGVVATGAWPDMTPPENASTCPWREDPEQGTTGVSETGALTWTLENLLTWRGFTSMITLLS
jgi:protein DGCR14